MVNLLGVLEWGGTHRGYDLLIGCFRVPWRGAFRL
jgi:hypothetical protein